MPGNGSGGDDAVRTTQEYEGFKDKSYADTKGIRTIGYGTNLMRSDMPARAAALGLDINKLRSGQQSITKEQADQFFQHDMGNAIATAPTLVSSYTEQPATAKQAINDMIYNMGPTVFGTFKNTIDKLNNRDYAGVARGLKNSSWYNQVGQRSRDIVQVFQDLADNK